MTNASDLKPWWQNSVIYQIYPRSFADATGTGVGDIQGIINHLGYLELLGVNAIWLSPITTSPMADHGYDVANPREIDPLFGGTEAFEQLLTAAHARDIRVIMDLVPNHTSVQHNWFIEALHSTPNSDARARYIFRDDKGPHGTEPPNNWPSIFGGPAWTRITEPDGTPGQWYLHIFAPEQPDLNWENPEIFDDLAVTLRFWLDKGIDGFRIDVAHGMAKPAGLPDMNVEGLKLLNNNDDDIRFNNPAVHTIHRHIRKVFNEYPHACSVGEIWVTDNVKFSEYVRPDELHLAFNFRLAEVQWTASSIREAITNSLAAVALTQSTPTWTLSNHDVVREATRLADADGKHGLARARALALIELALPGTVFIYNGAELGLPNVLLPDSALQDPTWERSNHTERGRDGCRVPLPWSGENPPFGFSALDETWLPIPESFADFTVEKQLENPQSTLSLYRTAIELRSTREEFTNQTLQWYGAPSDCLAFRRGPEGIICAANFGENSVPLPNGTVLLSSGELSSGQLPPNTAVWLTVNG